MKSTARCQWRRELFWAAVIAVAILTGCFGERSRPTVTVFGDLFVDSDPAGAEVFVDGRSTQELTPVVLAGVPVGRHDLDLIFSPGPAEFFGFSDTVTVNEELLDSVVVALEGGCSSNCPFLMDEGRFNCRSTGNGDTCASVFFDGVPALEWPAGSGTDYGAGGRLLLAGVLGDDAGAQAGDTVATQIYDVAWIGRRPMSRTTVGKRQVMELEYWGTSRYRSESLQGLLVKQTLVAIDSTEVEDVLFIQFEIENISDNPRYRRIYPWVPEGGYTLESLYVGFGLDADIGGSEQDLGTFDPALNLSFIYDAFFQDEQLGAFAERPALVGLVTVEPPSGAGGRTLTLWRRSDDWDDGDRHAFAWRLLAGRLAAGDPIADHPSAEIGFVSATPNDYRAIEAYGPLQLAPGDKVVMTVALILAEPVADSYTPGVLVSPGDPEDPNRAILTVAGGLRARAAALPSLWDRYRP